MAKQLGYVLTIPPTGCLSPFWSENLVFHQLQSPSSHSPPLLTQNLVDTISQWPSGKAFWPPKGEGAGMILTFQKQEHSGVPESHLPPSCCYTDKIVLAHYLNHKARTLLGRAVG